MVAKALVSFCAFLLASTIAHCEAVANTYSSDASKLSRDSANSLERHEVRSSVSSGAIPDWKVELVSEQQGVSQSSWWQRLGISSLWGSDLPAVASSPAQNQQHCPILKLPEEAVMAASSSSWMSLQGRWYTPTNVDIGTFDQNHFSFSPWNLNLSRKIVNFRAASTGQVAVRSRAFSDAGILSTYNWKVPSTAPGGLNSSKSANSSIAAIADEEPVNIALLDCVGNLMYVVRMINSWDIVLYGRDGSVLTSAVVEHPVLRMQFVYPPKNYLIATAEAPGINAKIPESDIPKIVESGNVLPFEIQFAPGGYKNSSLLMEPEFRWVLAVAVQSRAIYMAERDYTSWTSITVSWIIVICTYLLIVGAIVGLACMIYRCVYPHYDDAMKDHYGKIASNPFLAVPERPPPRDQIAAQSRQYAQQLGLHGKSMRYGSLV